MRGIMAVVLGVGLVVAAGCGPAPTHRVESPKDDHGHGPGPHDGVIGEWDPYHFEFTVDHKTQEATVYILAADAKTGFAIKTDKLTLEINEPRFTVELKPLPQEKDTAGAASRFVGKHEKLGKEQEFSGTVSTVIDGKPYSGEFKEEPKKK